MKKTNFIAIFLMLTMAFSILLCSQTGNAIPTVSWQKQMYAYVTASPNPAGVGQSVLIVMWLDLPAPWNPVTPDLAVTNTYTNIGGFMLTITKPDGSNTTLGPFVSDPTASAYTNFVPTVEGTYHVQFYFPGQALNRTISGTEYTFVMGPAMSASYAFTVQQQQVQQWPETPLPTAYWTRPVNGMNRQWATILGDWLELNYDAAGTKFNPYAQAPNSGHVVWTKPIWSGGTSGGNNGNLQYFYGVTYEPRWYGFVMNGILYYNVLNNPRYGWYATDLATGKTLFWQNSTLPSISAGITLASIYWPALVFGQELNWQSQNEHAVFPYLWSTNGSTWQMFDAFSGNYICQIINVPTGTRYVDQNGNELVYVLQAPTATRTGWLAQWNSTTAIGISPYFEVWRPQPGASYNAVNGYDWNVTLPIGSLPTNAAISRVLAGSGWPNKVDPVEIVGTAGGFTPPYPGIFGGTAAGTKDPWTVWAISVTNRGTILFNKNYPAPQGNLTLSLGPMDPSTGVWTVFAKETCAWYGYSLNTGELLWGPTPSQPAWDMYGAAGLVAYGNMYSAGYGGIIHCYDDKTGHLLWNYTAPNIGFESPYGNYPLTVLAAGDGKVFTISSEHSPTNPQWRGSMIRAINATTGQEIWKEECWGQAGTILTDGYLITLNAYDDQIYAFGKGPSSMTVTAPDVGVTTAAPITIRGTVIDKSAGTMQTQQAGMYPNGVPCVSDDSMSGFMEYLYQQQQMPSNTKGVPVSINVIDSNNNFRTIGTTTSDASGMYTLSWTPDIPGDYTVIANFAGSNSYYPSYAETSLCASAAAATPAPTQQVQIGLATTNDLMMYLAFSVVAIIIAIAIVGILLLRKRP